jgi:hypothetical protein
MSKESVDQARRGYDAFNGRDVDIVTPAMGAALAPSALSSAFVAIRAQVQLIRTSSRLAGDMGAAGLEPATSPV